MRVQLLVTCLVDQFFPETGMAVVEVLERLGVEVYVPHRQTCCGQPAFNAGFHDEARAMARHTLSVLSESDAPVVVPSGSCADMIVHQYAELFGASGRGAPASGGPERGGPQRSAPSGPTRRALQQDDAQRAAALAARTFEFSQFLVRRLGVADVGACARGSVAYHASCHGLRGLGLRDEPPALLAGVRGIEQRPLEEAETCCGFGGLFAVKMAEISAAMLDRKLDRIEASGADTVAVTDVSCLMHMAGGLRRRGSRVEVRHLADLLRHTDARCDA